MHPRAVSFLFNVKALVVQCSNDAAVASKQQVTVGSSNLSRRSIVGRPRTLAFPKGLACLLVAASV